MKIIQSNFGTIKVIDPVVPDSRTTAQGTYGKFAAQIASGGRVKYRGAGLVDHGPAGVRQGYAEKRIGIKDEKGLFTGVEQAFSDEEILEEAKKLEIKTKGQSPDEIRKEVKRVKAAITRKKKMSSELTKEFKEFYKTENFNVNEDGKFVQKQSIKKIPPEIAAKKFGVTPAVYSEMGAAYMKDLKEKGHLVGADTKKVDIKRKESKIKGEAEAGEKAIKQNKIMKDAIRAENKKLITSLDKNPKATIAAIRNNPNLMEQLTSFWNKKTGKIEKIEKYKNGISDADIKRYIKSGLYSEEHISPLSKGAKNVEFPKNKAWVTKQGNTKILQQMSDWLNTGENFNLNDSKVIDAKKWLTKHSLSTKVQNWKGFWGDDSLKKLSAVEAQAAQFNKIKVDYPKTS